MSDGSPYEIIFEDPVWAGCHAQLSIGALGRTIGLFHIEPKATDSGSRASLAADGLVHSPIDSLTAPGRIHVDALNPPKHGVSPVAPFVGDHELPDDAPHAALVDLGYPQKAECRRRHDGVQSFAEPPRVEDSRFRLHGHGSAEANQRREIAGLCRPKAYARRHAELMPLSGLGRCVQPAFVRAVEAGGKLHLHGLLDRKCQARDDLGGDEGEVSGKGVNGRRNEDHQQ